MADDHPDPVFDAFLAARDRGVFATALDTAGLRELSAEVRYNAVFSARCTSLVFVQEIKDVIDDLTGDKIGTAQAIARLAQKLRALGYTPEHGFPGETEIEAVRGSIQDLSSYRRLELIVETQLALMTGRGEKMRGETPGMLRDYPAWELVRQLPAREPRDWYARWAIAGGKLYGDDRQSGLYKPTGIIALKGDPVWGELGSSDNFSDALDVDHPPFAFNSGMGWRAVSRAKCEALNVAGPNGESIDEWLASRPVTLSGHQPPPAPKLGVRDIDPALAGAAAKELGATIDNGILTVPVDKYGDVDYSDLLASAKARRDAARAAGKAGGQ